MAFIDIKQLYRVLSSVLLCITAACTSSIKQVWLLLAVSAVTNIPWSKSRIDQNTTNLLFYAQQTGEDLMIYCGEVCKILQKFREASTEKKEPAASQKQSSRVMSLPNLCKGEGRSVMTLQSTSPRSKINISSAPWLHLETNSWLQVSARPPC